MSALQTDLTVRPLGVDDLAAVTALLTASDMSVLGRRDAPLDLSDPDPAIRLRRSDKSEEDLRVAHRIEDTSLREHYGHVATSFETWRERLTGRGAGFAEIWLAELDGEAVGLLVGTRQFQEDDNAGYVRTLGTMPAARGKGVAKALLRTYFDVSRREGRSAVLLHVDVANVTGALGLYESVGMRPVLEIDAWTKRSPTRMCADTPD
ncbi:MAG: GNAT family N-acetyltransferase [Actinomycetes bacterium]